jgi:acyl dehydratase
VGGATRLVRAALPAVPGVNLLPGIRKVRGPFTGMAREHAGIPVLRDQVDAYAAVCGFPRKDTVPLTFPHVLAFPLHLGIMGDPSFPWPAIGTVHVENVVTAHRPLRVGEVLDLTVAVDPPRPHAKGVLLDFRTSAMAGDGLVWESTSTYLRRGATTPPGEPDPGLDLPAAPTGALEWRLPGDLGRRYAAVSGDLNPIHLHPLTARALGFPRQIAHGMWSLARCVAALENRLPDAVTVEAVFRRPVLLPGTVAFGHEVVGAEHRFSLTRPRDGATHLLGVARPA